MSWTRILCSAIPVDSDLSLPIVAKVYFLTLFYLLSCHAYLFPSVFLKVLEFLLSLSGVNVKVVWRCAFATACQILVAQFSK
jgi:hypothetical protein